MAYIKLAPYNNPNWVGATALLPGLADQNMINSYLLSGNTVELGPGNINCNGNIIPQSGSTWFGQGSTTIINLNDPTGNGNANIYLYNQSNITLGSFKITGNGSVIIECTTNQINFTFHDIWNTASKTQDFVIKSTGGTPTISNINYIRCKADNPDGRGFYIWNNSNTTIIDGLVFYQCQVINAGVAATRTDIWVTGFSFCDADSTLTVKNISVIKCTTNGAWESDFHFEVLPHKQSVVMLDNVATLAGRKPSPYYGAGILCDAQNDFLLFGNSGSNNAIADISVWNGSSYNNYPMQNMVIGSTKIPTRITQGNCTGIAVKNGNVWDIYLYSLDNNSVVQSLTLPDGTPFIANFTDFLIQLNIPSNPGAFTVGSSHTAAFKITENPYNEPCQFEFWLGPNQTTKVATAGKVNFTSGANVPVTCSITMPDAGTYNVYVDVYMLGVLIDRLVASSTITVI